MPEPRFAATPGVSARTGLPPGIGHNGGPPLEEEPDPGGGRLFLWRQAHRKAWKTPPPEIALRRLARAEALGMSYRDYTREILERARHL